MRENHDFSVIIDFWRVGLNNHAIFFIFGWRDGETIHQLSQLGLFHIEWINGFCQWLNRDIFQETNTNPLEKYHVFNFILIISHYMFKTRF